MTYFCSIGSQILYIFETHGIGQTPSSLERYLVIMKLYTKSTLKNKSVTSIVITSSLHILRIATLSYLVEKTPLCTNQGSLIIIIYNIHYLINLLN